METAIKQEPKECHDFAWAVEQIDNAIKVKRKIWDVTNGLVGIEYNRPFKIVSRPKINYFSWVDVSTKDWVLFRQDFIWARSKINDGFHVSRLSSPCLDIHFEADKDIWISEYKAKEKGEFFTIWKREFHTCESWEQYIERFRGTDDWIISTIQQEV